MKKNFLLSILMLLLTFNSILANSTPTYWQAYPLSESLVIDKTVEVAINNEHLVFDFNDENIPDNSFWLSAAVSATYQMENESDKEVIVNMMFPFIDQLSMIDVDLLSVYDDDNEIDHTLLINLNKLSDGSISELNGFVSGLNESDIDLDQEAVLYKIEAKANDESYLSVDIRYQNEDVVVIGFNDLGGYQYNGDDSDRLAGWIRDDKTFYLLSINGEIELNINGYTDYQMSSEKKIDHLLSTSIVNARSYLLDYLKEDIDQGLLNKIDDDQFINIINDYIDEQENRYLNDWDLKAELDSDRLYGMHYQVTFKPKQTKKITVNYLINGTMDKSNTVEPIYHFTYLLSPAKNWASFKDLTIDIYTPQDNRHIIDSSINLKKITNDHYQFESPELIDGELEFSLYTNEDISFIDRTAKVVERWQYVLIFFSPIVIAMIALWLFLTYKLKKKNKNRRRFK
ncbi:MAG: hypothetical protein PHP11_03070 [Erysipelotrichaceae bacterium]|nr:hypothetical protein [Erysipelotrichaceae bacterium]MDD3924062.1 hypothetical protein [Erysipelotrichaceae bacterium]